MAPAIQPLRFDPRGLFAPGVGIVPQDLELLYPVLAAARQSLSGRSSPAASDHADQPQRILADYRGHRQRSELGRILAAARRFTESVDRIVVVAGEPTLLAVRALKAACCHPYHNELSRAERGGQPRMYFAGDSLDNDALAGLLDLLHQDCRAPGPEGSWGVIAVGETNEAKAGGPARGLIVRALEQACGGDPQQLRRRWVSIHVPGHLLDYFSQESGICDTFDLPGGAGDRRSVFDAAGLLPAATLGIDVRRLLEGAAAMHAHFQTAQPAENIVLHYSGALHLLDKLRGPRRRQLVPWAAGFDSLAAWYENLLVASRVATGGAGEQAIIINFLVDQPRRDRLMIDARWGVDDPRSAVAGRYLPDIQQGAIDVATQTHRAAGRLFADLHLPRLDESALGQLFQLLALTTAVECELDRNSC